jgi:hydroxyethylthiazole kinase-like uncharacterized protein yjeF
MRALTSAQMREADRAAVARGGDVVLMRAAGAALAEAIDIVAPAARTLVAFAGPGNNGGDAYAAFAAHAGQATRTVYALRTTNVSEGRRDAQERAQVNGVVTRPFPTSPEEAQAAIAGADLVLDALLGTGARPDLPSEMRVVVEALAAVRPRILAVDIPTGIDATSGAVGSLAVRATATVTLGAPKIGLLLEPARAYAGELYVGDIGIAHETSTVAGAAFEVLDDTEFLRLLPARDDESDKRRSGAPLVVAGSEQFPGAAVLCSHGAARAGAGYVTVAAGRGAAAALRAHLVEQVVITYDESDVEGAIETLLDLTNHSNAVGIGPGLGLSANTAAIVRGFIERLERPFVADASALTHLAKHLDILRGKACVVTPHASEFSRLSGEGTIAPGTRVDRLRAFVDRTGITTLLKGSATLVYDGTTMHVNVTGTSALATAGTGDVLTGIIATLLAQGLSPVDAARAGAYWHGLSGRRAARERNVGVMASDVAEGLGPSLHRAQPGYARLTRLI